MKSLILAISCVSCLVGCGSAAPNSDLVSGEAPSADGVPIRYEVRGSADPTLVLLHGWTNSRAIWGEHPATLSRSHRVVAIDLAGHGESGDGRAEWTMDAFGEDVVAVVEELALDEVVLVGFSMGGAVALEAAERMPERVLGIVFVDTFHDPDAPPIDVDQMEALFRAACCDTAFVRAFAFTPDAPDSLIRQVAQAMPAQPLEHWFPILHAANQWNEMDFRATLGRTQAPVAAINTTRTPTNVEALRGYASSFTVDTLAGLGHAGILLQRVDDFDARLLAIVERFREATP